MEQDNSSKDRLDSESMDNAKLQDEALEWFVRLRGQEVDQPTLHAFERWHGRSSRHAQAYLAIEAMWQSRAFKSAISEFSEVAGIERIHKQKPRRSRALKQYVCLAAAGLATIMVCVWTLPEVILHWRADYVTVAGQQTGVVLPDGSKMTMNTDSAVAINFHDGHREVTLLQGEAFFDVRHDAMHPFLVTGPFGITKVTGTAFSVRTDRQQDRVILERGHVDVRLRSGDGGHTQLDPGEMVTASYQQLSGVKKSDPSIALAWRNGRLVFDAQPFTDVVHELSRYYAGRVFIIKSGLEKSLVSGNFRLDDIESAFRTLSESCGVTITYLPGGTIFFR